MTENPVQQVTANAAPIIPLTSVQPFARHDIRRPAAKPSRAFQSVAKTLPHQTRRLQRARDDKFRTAAILAHRKGWPLCLSTTIVWDTLLTHAKTVVRDGHCLGRGDGDRSLYVRREIARLFRNEDVAWAALWSRDVGFDNGPHDHIFQFCPDFMLRKMVATIERVTGSDAEFVETDTTKKVAARSVCGGWQMNHNIRSSNVNSAIDFAEYVARQHVHHPKPPIIAGKAFGITRAIAAPKPR
jgi:hypothetical protein